MVSRSPSRMRSVVCIPSFELKERYALAKVDAGCGACLDLGKGYARLMKCTFQHWPWEQKYALRAVLTCEPLLSARPIRDKRPRAEQRRIAARGV